MVARHHVHGEIASGGMATVFLASFSGAGSLDSVIAALKRLHPHLAKDPSFRKMLVEEARLSARIEHPNLVRTLAVLEEEDDDVVIAMEYALGLPLIEALQLALASPGSVDVAVAVAIVVGMLRGLDAAHEACDAEGGPLGIVHRDVSPQNVIVCVDGIPRLLDFGIAKARDRLTTTDEGMVRGKQGYMAPEQLAGEPLSRAVDIFATGVVLWELVAGVRLFSPEGTRRGSLARRLLEDVAERPSEHRARDATSAPARLDEVILRSLRRQPSERFASAAAMADALTAAVAPASPEQVAAWLERIGGEELSRLRARLAAVQSYIAAGGDGDDETLRQDSWSRPTAPRQLPGLDSRVPRRTRRLLDAAITLAVLTIGGAVATKAMLQAARFEPERTLTSLIEAARSVVGTRAAARLEQPTEALAPAASAPLPGPMPPTFVVSASRPGGGCPAKRRK